MRTLPLLALALLVATPAAAGDTLETVKKRGTVRCGVAASAPGFSAADSQGVRRGLDVDFCKAVAAALFGDAAKVEFVATTTQNRFTALQSGEVDLLSRVTTWTLQRGATLGFNFAAVTFYDGQGLMVPKKLNVTSARALDGATVCIQPGTTTELGISDYFRANKMTFKSLVIENVEETRAAYFSGRCDVYTTDRSSVAALRANAPSPDDHVVLPELISKEPLAIAVRKGDEEWADVVRWSVYATLDAEENGVTSANAEAMLASPDPNVKRLLGVTPGNGKALGLDERWAFNIVKQVGNYGEIYERNVGAGSALKLPRGLNDLWTRGGLMYAPPLR